MKVKELLKLIDRLDPESNVMRASTFEINNRIKVCAKLIVPVEDLLLIKKGAIKWK